MEPGRAWTGAEKAAYRFLTCYLVLFYFPVPAGLVNPYWLGGALNALWARLVPWVAGRVLHVELPNLNNGGSGDSTFEYVRVLCTLILSAAGAAVWTVLDRRRRDYRVFHSWLRIWLRYALALCMLTFGAVKVLMVQFEPPGYGRLVQPLGQFSPMALLWTFMGYSPLYTSFTGVTEVTGALLLLFRRTTTLGALVVAAAMAHVLVLNMSYDVPVKLGALHVLLLALTLLASDASRLLDAFVLNRATAAADLGPHMRGALGRWALGAKAVVIVALLVYFTHDTITTHRRHVAALTPDPVAPYGWYRVQALRKDGVEAPPLAPEELRIRTVSFREDRVSLRGIDGTMHRFRSDGDATRGMARLFPLDAEMKPIPDAPTVGAVRLIVAGGRVGRLVGTLYGKRIEAELQRENPSDMPLMNRGFRWISEAPYFN